MKRLTYLPMCCLLLQLVFLSYVSAAPNPPQKSSDKSQKNPQITSKYVRSTDPGLYVGSETCKNCHEDIYTGFATTPHFATTMDAKLDAHKGPEWRDCKACHGPDKEPVDGGGDKTKIFAFKGAPYTSKVNTSFIDFSWTPTRRMTLRGGADLSSASGNELNLTPQNPIATQVPGPLNSTWYQPFGGINQFAKHWTGRAMWDYYGYHENASTAYQDLLAQRNFQGNLVMLSVRYAF